LKKPVEEEEEVSDMYPNVILIMFPNYHERRTSSAVSGHSVYNVGSVSTNTRLGVTWFW
jgi:hypothetical protein